MLNKFNYKNYIRLNEPKEGDERRIELISDILENGTFLPRTVLYKDIDEAFKEWVEKELSIQTEDGKDYPTFTLFSNQRFSEYSQSWKHVDDNNNLLLEFKSINRDNNPQYGNIQKKLWNIPEDKYYLIRREKVLDDNGTESFLDLRMKQPTAIDFTYKVSIFTTKYQKINEFNQLINRKFNCCQCYIFPNNHPMPMKLENISDESQYNIDDRQYYSQVYSISLMGYIITEDDYRVEERPLKMNGVLPIVPKRNKADVEIDECHLPKNPYYYQPLAITLNFDLCSSYAEFTLDTDFVIDSVEYENVMSAYCIFFRNDEKVALKAEERLREGDVIKVKIRKRMYKEKCVLITIYGYNPEVVYDEAKDVPEVILDETQYMTITKVSATEGSKIEETKEKDYVIGENEIKNGK